MKPTHASSNHDSLKSGFMYQKKRKKLEGWKSAFIAFSDKASVCETCSVCKVSLHRASIFKGKQSFSCHDVVTSFLSCTQKAKLYKRATELDFQQLYNQSAKIQCGSNISGAYSTLWKEPSHPPNTKQILFCASVLSVCVMYDFDRLSSAFPTDRPELVNRCCWSSWGWGHGVSPQTWSKRLPQPPVSPQTWFMSLCHTTLWLPANTELKVNSFCYQSTPQGQHTTRNHNNSPKPNKKVASNKM